MTTQETARIVRFLQDWRSRLVGRLAVTVLSAEESGQLRTLNTVLAYIQEDTSPESAPLQALAEAAAAEEDTYARRERDLCMRCGRPRAEHPAVSHFSSPVLAVRICPTALFTGHAQEPT